MLKCDDENAAKVIMNPLPIAEAGSHPPHPFSVINVHLLGHETPSRSAKTLHCAAQGAEGLPSIYR